MSFTIDAIRKRSRLPHWDVRNGIYALTTHLGDALPLEARLRIRQRMEHELDQIRRQRRDVTMAEQTAARQRYHRRLNALLDRGYGECVLRDPRAARIVADALTRFDDQRYVLFSWSVMPNHFHAVFRCIEPHALADVVQGWKSASVHRVNRALGRKGNLWEEDYWDRTIRDEKHFRASVDYVLSNPAKVGLRDWPFARVYPERVAQVLGY